jgi:hypothetical protein
MARILLEVTTAQGTLTEEDAFANDARFIAILERAFNPPAGLTPRQRLRFCLRAIEAYVQSEATLNDGRARKAALEAQVITDNTLEEPAP